jgi:hypothetical protein
MPMPEKPRDFLLRLRPVPGAQWRHAPWMRLRALLKTALRGFGLRCVSVREIDSDGVQHPTIFETTNRTKTK